MELSENARMALDTLRMEPTHGVCSWMAHFMENSLIEELAGCEPGSYRKDPVGVYLRFQKNVGTCFIDQFIPENPLSMADWGYDSGTGRGATTGAHRIELDGMLIDSPEAVVAHMERFVFPALEHAAASYDTENEAAVEELIRGEEETQKLFGPDILKVPYGRGFSNFPVLRYGSYGYANYFMAYALYPEVMERDFSLQADLNERQNVIGAKAFVKGNLPPVVRSDHDMADSRGTLADIKSLDRLWFPHFARAMKPLIDAGVRVIWHCDGNLMEMVPRLIECGLSGFQGFQYEDGMDYERICAMKDCNGDPLMIWAGASVTRTLPRGTKDDVIRELNFLVENGPGVGLVLGCSSSVTPGTNRENLMTLLEGLKYFRTKGRKRWKG
ncbi:MAG TPA: hypothetical protein PL033_02565 [Candidatus Brocadiia bacterium]|nr:hypothetical protein [Candidatus Brocadiia bacterium]